MTRDAPEPDPDQPDIPAAPADVPPGTSPAVRSQGGTSETMPAVEGVRTPAPDDPE